MGPPPWVKPEPKALRRMLPKVEETVVVTEKESMFGFPFLNGKMDYALLMGKEPNSHRWCKDLFLSRWDRGISAHVSLPPLHSKSPSGRSQFG